MSPLTKATMKTDLPPQPPLSNGWRRRLPSLSTLFAIVFSALVLIYTTKNTLRRSVGVAHPSPHESEYDISRRPHAVRHYNLTVGARWLNLDGGRWRPMFVCNGESPCPTLVAEEGDTFNLHVINDLGAQLSIHWAGMSHRRLGFWNDGTGGLNQYPILPRGNWTSTFDTTDHWGLGWYADHTGAGVVDGVYGMVYVAPSPKRERPYKSITKSPSDLELIMEAEREVRHLALWNSDIRTADWKITKMKGTGALSDLYCYKSILVNGKGRVFCGNHDYDEAIGSPVDESGCLIQDGFAGHPCKPSVTDVEVIETKGRDYIMLNLINIGFEHALKFSIDEHPFWVVATDAGFVEPQEVDTVYITNGARVTILIKLDKEPQDYAMRLASTSTFQNLEGMSILRYPAKRYPLLGEPMKLPQADEAMVCLRPDSSVPDHCKELDHSSVQPLPKKKLPHQSDMTLKWTAGGQQSKFAENVTEFFVNGKPWQLFRAAMKPVILTNDASDVQKPIQGGLPYGTVVDLIVQNTINDTIPMYKHGDATWHLGSRAHEEFAWDSVEDAVKHGAAVNVKNPSMALVHDLPPLGWVAIRWRINLRGATMFHAVKVRYFALGMAAPLLEGIEKSMADEVPAYAKEQPHVVFEPKNPGVFGK